MGLLAGERSIEKKRRRRLTILRRVPIFRQREFAVQPPFSFRLVIDTVEADDTLQEDVQLGMARWVTSDFEERVEDVCVSLKRKGISKPCSETPVR